MRDKLLIVLLAIATTFVLLLAVIPHHHHEGMWCSTVELCHTDDTENDEHTSHQGDTTSCIEETEFITSMPDIVKCSIEDYHLHYILLLPILTCCLLSIGTQKTILKIWDRPILNYSSGWANAVGLRAPPVMF